MGSVALDHIEAGAGPAVVLLHAFPFPPAMWEPQLAALSDRWRVIAPELAPDRHDSLDAIGDSVAALIDDLGVGPAVIGGLSMGGYTTFAFLRRHRHLARAVILADTRAGADAPEVRDRRESQQAIVARDGTGPIVEAQLAGLPGAYTKAHRPEVMAALRKLMCTVSPAYVIGALDAMKRRPDSTADLRGIDLPALIVVGNQDTVAPPSTAEEMQRALPHAELAVIPDAGHVSNLEDPAAFNTAVRAFLEKLA